MTTERVNGLPPRRVAAARRAGGLIGRLLGFAAIAGACIVAGFLARLMYALFMIGWTAL